MERAHFRNYPPVLGKVVNFAALKGKQCEILQFKYFKKNLVLNSVQKLNNCSKPDQKWFVAKNTTLQYQYTTEIGDDCNGSNTAIVLGLISPEPASGLVILCIRTHWAPTWRVEHLILGHDQKNSNNINKRWTTIHTKDEISRQRNRE